MPIKMKANEKQQRVNARIRGGREGGREKERGREREDILILIKFRRIFLKLPM